MALPPPGLYMAGPPMHMAPYQMPPLGPPPMLGPPPPPQQPSGRRQEGSSRGRKSRGGRESGKDAHAQRARSVLSKQMQKTKLCDFHKEGRCKYGSACAFAHSAEELKEMPDLRKTRICRAFSRGDCSDANCKFAHGAQELRTTDLCYKTAAENGCRFAHGSEEIRADEKAVADGEAAPLAQGNSQGGSNPVPKMRLKRRLRQRLKKYAGRAAAGGGSGGGGAGTTRSQSREPEDGPGSDSEDQPASKRLGPALPQRCVHVVARQLHCILATLSARSAGSEGRSGLLGVRT
eukprot:CAMPEP_0179132166 /NCGR_PEP_ID=MMETSP0796-20121207/62807_1 /TAXON_ID=73915 /ORGANISM="Pyrodinium bahamense, Strain pbaha01" /LENGTH=290 /DNA_ID=CAMNT_0020831103 /DNA_START=125 /DNA_END=998 /DNA_ORIENTATION=+